MARETRKCMFLFFRVFFVGPFEDYAWIEERGERDRVCSLLK